MAQLIFAESPPVLDAGPTWRGRRVLVVEDGPTLTHGGMPFGAGLVAARQAGAARIVGSAARGGRLDPGRVRAAGRS